MTYLTNKQKARTRTTEPSLTDQSQAYDTDINVIVGRFLKTGAAPGTAQEPMSGDFSELPEDLRGYIEASRSIKDTRRRLPTALKDMPIEELLALTPDKLTDILTPPPKETNDGKQNRTPTEGNQGKPPAV